MSSLEENLVFCPISVLMTLAMLGTGAKESTALEMERVLNLPSLAPDSQTHADFSDLIKALVEAQSDDLQMIIANAAYVQKGMNVTKEFQFALEMHYRASVKYVDYATDGEGARTDINLWIEQQTRDKIKDMLSPGLLDEYTRLVLVNAVYMKGLWASQFSLENTNPDTFYLLDQSERTVDMMYQKGKFRLAKNEKLSCKMLEMPYEGGEFAMYILLPDDTDGLPELEKSLTNDAIGELMTGLNKQSVFTWLPRFTAETSVLALETIIPALGISELFDEQKANLLGITGERNLFVSNLLHKAVLVVDEKGSEAAAATVGVVRLMRSMSFSEEFRCNHPFLYFIRHSSGVTLFMGRVTSPTAASGATKDEL